MRRSRIATLAVVAILIALGLLAGDRIVRWGIRSFLILPSEDIGREHHMLYAVNDLLKARPDADHLDAAIFLDSTNDSIAVADSDRRFISQFFAERLGDAGVRGYGVSFPSMGIDWIEALMPYWLTVRPSIDAVVIPINIRWTSPTWRGLDLTNGARRPYAFYSATTRLIPWLIPSGYMSPTVRGDRRSETVPTPIGDVPYRYMNLKADKEAKSHLPADEVSHTLLRGKMALAYGTAIGPEDPLFAVLGRILTQCRERKVQCVFYLPPYNIGGTRELAPEVLPVLEGNLGLVRDWFARQGEPLLDLSDTLPPEDFRDIVNEHVNEAGRRLVGRCVAEAVVRRLGRGNQNWTCPSPARGAL